MWARSSQTSLVIAKNFVDLEEMDRVKTLDTGNNFKVTNQSNPVESLNDLEELFIAQYFYRKLHEKINHGIGWGTKYEHYEDTLNTILTGRSHSAHIRWHPQPSTQESKAL